MTGPRRQGPSSPKIERTLMHSTNCNRKPRLGALPRMDSNLKTNELAILYGQMLNRINTN
jgi:hypothetical protein